jgi:DNA-binding transcriptional LysR family regulator
MDLNLIGVFVEIVDSHSLSAAARKLGMTRANISQRLKLLERETGAQLLRRSTRRLELTQAGHDLSPLKYPTVKLVRSAGVASPDSGPHGWGGRLIVTFLFRT